MLMRHQNGVEISRVFADREQAGLYFAAAQPGVDQHPRAIGSHEDGIAGTG
jgi:hypothetical protein